MIKSAPSKIMTGLLKSEKGRSSFNSRNDIVLHHINHHISVRPERDLVGVHVCEERCRHDFLAAVNEDFAAEAVEDDAKAELVFRALDEAASLVNDCPAGAGEFAVDLEG